MAATDMAETRPAKIVTSSTDRPERVMRHFLADFAVALIVFAVAAGLIGVDASNAFPMPPPPELSLVAALPGPSMPVPAMIVAVPTFPGMAEAPSTAQTLSLFALAFASLVATNLAIGRHLLRAYASPRRKGSRRG